MAQRPSRPSGVGPSSSRPSGAAPRPSGTGVRPSSSGPGARPSGVGPARPSVGPAPGARAGPRAGPGPTKPTGPPTPNKSPQGSGTDVSKTKLAKWKLGKKEGSKEQIKPAQSPGPSYKDILFITVIWTTQMVYHVLDVSLARFNHDYIASSNFDSREIEIGGLNSWAVLFITIIAMMGTGFIFQSVNLLEVLKVVETFKYWITFGLLAVYYISAPVGILLTTTKSSALFKVTAWLQICWNVFSPIRFWYIFHQFFPISVRWSHLLVSGNILAIGIVEYIVVISMEAAPDVDTFSEVTYYGVFAISTVAAIGWLVGLIFLKKLQHRFSGELSAARELYKNTEIIEKFNRKQSLISTILFIALITPAAIIPVMNEFVKLGRNKLTDNAIMLDRNWVHFRFDLLISLFVVLVVEVILQFMKKIRNELTDLVLIVISHIINVVVVLLFLNILYDSLHTRQVMGETSVANFMIINAIKGDIVLDFEDGLKDIHVSTFADGSIIKVLNDKPIRLTISRDKTIIHEQSLTLFVERCTRRQHKFYLNFYIFRIFENKFELYKAPISYLDFTVPQPMFFSPLQNCSNYSHPVAEKLGYLPNVTTGLLSETGQCLPMAWQAIPAPLDQKEPNFDDYPPFKPPEYNSFYRSGFKIECGPEFSIFAYSCNSFLVTYYKLYEYLIAVDPELEGKALKQLTIELLANVRLNYILILAMKYHNLHYLNRTFELPVFAGDWLNFPEGLPEMRLLFVMGVYGLSLGIAWVGYIHFIWIQCPIRWRIIIIYLFFSIIYASSSFSKQLMTEFTDRNLLVVLAFTVLFTIWQIGTTTIFAARWSVQHRDDPPQQPWHRF